MYITLIRYISVLQYDAIVALVNTSIRSQFSFSHGGNNEDLVSAIGYLESGVSATMLSIISML